MYSSHLRLVAVGTTIIGAVLTGLLTGWVAAATPDAAMFSVPAAAAGFLGALLAGGIAAGVLLAAARARRGPGAGAALGAGGAPGTAATGPAGSGSDGVLDGRVEQTSDAYADVDPSRPGVRGGVPAGFAGMVPTGARGAVPTGAGDGALLDGAATAAPHAPATAVALEPDLRADREALVQACIYVRDRATSKAIADRIGWALHDVGVATIAPAAGPFDPGQHEAGGSVPTEDPRLDGTIAGVEAPGYVDRGVVVRPPVVTVYRGRP